MELKIEKDIPAPIARQYLIRGAHGALSKMEVGDSVLVNWASREARGAAAYAFGKGNYATRKVEGGIRIWRLK